MATKTLEKTRLQIRFVDAEGSLSGSYSLSRIDPKADASVLLAMAKAITGLQTLSAKDYRLIDTSQLSD